MIPTLTETETLVREAFEGQTDKGGVPIAEHMARVVARLPQDDEILLHIGWLHDILEDTKVTIDHYPAEVIEAVQLLTRPKKMPYPEYIDRLIASGNRRAIMVKLADNMDNTDPHRWLHLNRYMQNALSKRYAGVKEKLLCALISA